MFDVAGLSLFPNEPDNGPILEALINSSTGANYLSFLSPTLNFEVGNVTSIPVVESILVCFDIKKITEENEGLSREDWDAFETSWDFARHPLLPPSGGGPALLSGRFADWEAECQDRFDNLRANEEELNRIFARFYHMEGEVPIEVPQDKVSVRLADRARDAKSLVSYAVGCMLGRYSDEADGLVLADQGATLDDFIARAPGAAFLPDAQNVLPVLDGEWFSDDAVSGLRRWLAHAFGEETLGENVAWLEESLGKPLRAYLCRDFYTDHLKAYQKRPIYWMFQSPKKTFQCLVYMHRYDEGTVGTVLTGYLRPLEEKLRARLRELEAPGATAAEVRQATKVRNQVSELEAWERDVVYPLAQERVPIDLDDGVKANYNRFPRALAKVAGLSEWR